MPPEIVSSPEGLRARSAPLWLDASRRTPCSFVSHAHADHVARHERVIASAPTLALLAARGGKVEGLPAPWRRPFSLGPLSLELFPAGHMLGSAQLRVTARDGHRTVFTGDLDVVPHRTAEPCEVARCDTLVLEATFGAREAAFPPREALERELVAFCEAALAAGEVPVLLAHPLGKAQELAAVLGAAGLPARLHPRAFRFVETYRAHGHALPTAAPLGRDVAPGEVVIWPPGLARSRRLARLGARTCAVTGWAREGPPPWGADAGVALSDHADLPGLVSYAKATGAREVLTHHGAAGALAAALRDAGLDARPIAPPPQLALPL